MFEEDIHRYDLLAKEYVRQVVEPMGKAGFQKYSEIMLSCHSCGIEGSSFSVDDTRALFEEGLGYRPVGKSLLECQEMADHFAAYEWMHSQLDHAFDVELVPFSSRLPWNRCATNWNRNCKEAATCSSFKTYSTTCGDLFSCAAAGRYHL